MSFIQGEQVEYPVTLNFIANVGIGYTYEAVLMEALNVSGDDGTPTMARPAGVNTTLTVRVPPYEGNWTAPTAYDREDVIIYNSIYYKLYSGTARVNATPPPDDPLWEVWVPNKIYIQFPSTLSSTWSIQPTIVSSVKGFFELSITEPAGGVYTRTFKHLRGIIEFLYSPTKIVT